MTQVMVDMSVTLLHHGHVRLLKKAKEIGIVVVSLATDELIIKYKKIVPLLNYEARKEILSAIKYVDKIVSCPMYYIDDNFLKKHKCDFLVHGDDNQNLVSKNKLIIFSRTEGISSTKLRNEKNF
jgi:cytidyltransferase-like protein